MIGRETEATRNKNSEKTKDNKNQKNQRPKLKQN